VKVAGLACGSKGMRAVQSRQINASSGPSQRRQSRTSAGHYRIEESLDISRRDATVEVEEERQTTESRLACQQDTPAVVGSASKADKASKVATG